MKRSFHTREKELELIAVAQAGFAAEESKAGPTIERWNAISAGIAARNELIETNHRWICRVTYNTMKWMKRVRETQDFIGSATLGYFHAIRKFSEAKGCRLNTYATSWMFRYIREAAVSRKGTLKYECESRTTSMHGFAGNIVADAMLDPESDVVEYRNYVINTVQTAISTLSPRSAEILRLRMSGMSQLEIGRKLGITKQAVEQRETRSRKKLAEFQIIKRLA